MASTDKVEVRRPPTAAVFASHAPRKLGKCDWCGLPHDDRTPARNQLKRRHNACHAEYMQIVSTAVMREAVFARDKGICSGCGEDWSGQYIIRPAAARDRFPGGDLFIGQVGLSPEEYRAGRIGGFYTACSIISISRWHADHRTPLWKSVHLPSLQRIEYFKLAAIVTLCDECHEVKTTKEAAERAKWNGQAERAEQLALDVTSTKKSKSKWGSRPMQSGNRWPPKGSRKMGKRK